MLKVASGAEQGRLDEGKDRAGATDAAGGTAALADVVAGEVAGVRRTMQLHAVTRAEMEHRGVAAVV